MQYITIYVLINMETNLINKLNFLLRIYWSVVIFNGIIEIYQF